MQFSSIEDQVTQNTVWAFFWIISRQTDKIHRTFPKFSGFVRQTGGFCEDCLILIWIFVPSFYRFYFEQGQTLGALKRSTCLTGAQARQNRKYLMLRKSELKASASIILHLSCRRNTNFDNAPVICNHFPAIPRVG